MNPTAEFKAECDTAAQAAQASNPGLLPAPARAIYDRMLASAKTFMDSRAGPRMDKSQADRYCTALAWRAIRQNYGIPVKAVLGKRLTRQTKSTILAGAISGMDGGSFIVPITSNRQDIVDRYERVEDMKVVMHQHDDTGAIVRVGISPGNHRNIIDVRVPSSLVSTQPSGAGAVKWVQNNWHHIWYTAKGMIRAGVKSGFGFQRSSVHKFVMDPKLAEHRTAYGVVYEPWSVDLQGDYATGDEVMKMAHEFTRRLTENSKIGEMHGRFTTPDGQPPGQVVESFVAPRNHPHFPEGAWVLGTQFHPEVWKKILSGEYRGYSIGGRWGGAPVRLSTAA